MRPGSASRACRSRRSAWRGRSASWGRRADQGLLLLVDVQPDLLLPIGDGDASLGRRDDDGLARRRRPEFLRQVDLDRQDVPFDRHMDVFRSEERRVGKECRAEWERGAYKKKN